jgi:hypothetical protein
VSRARKVSLRRERAITQTLLAAYSFIAGVSGVVLWNRSHHIVLSAGNLMMKSGLPSCWMDSKLPPSQAEGSVVKIEPALAERSRIHPFAA